MKRYIFYFLIFCLVLSISALIFIKIQKPLNIEIITPYEKTKYPLYIDIEIIVKGYTGNLVVQLENKRVRIKESSCQNQICVKTGWISRVGDMIVCAPNRVTVAVLSN